MPRCLGALLLGMFAVCGAPFPAAAETVRPLTVGFDIDLTGALAPNGKAVLLAWRSSRAFALAFI